MFSEVLNGEYQRRAQETWSPWIDTLDHLFENTYHCGYSPCDTMLDDTLEWVAGHGVSFLTLFGAFTLPFPTVLVPMYQHLLVLTTVARSAERYLHAFGYTHFLASHGPFPLLKDD